MYQTDGLFDETGCRICPLTVKVSVVAALGRSFNLVAVQEDVHDKLTVCNASQLATLFAIHYDLFWVGA